MDTSETFEQYKEDATSQMSEATNRLKDFQHRAGDVAKRAGYTTDQYVRENTWAAIGVAALVGCLIGYVLSNGVDRD